MCSVSYKTELNGGEQLDFQIINKDEGNKYLQKIRRCYDLLSN